jgi:radical SAM protein with 4Fe4S-binding SPASM domain
VEYARSRKVKKIATNTNASFLEKTNIEGLLTSGLDEIYISFDAALENSYRKIRPGLDFYKVESNIKELVRKKKEKKLRLPRIYLSFVKCSHNRNEVDLYLSKWKGVVDCISISYLVNWGGKFSGENLLEDTKRRDPCRFLWTDMVISYNGKVAMCCYDYENEIIIGDISKENIMDIWSGKILNALRKSHLKYQFDDISLCKNCVANLHSKNPWWVVN